MLFFLTGDIQIGKTRWLEKLVLELQECGIEPLGVIAPGTWIEHREEAKNKTVSYEKTGIDNLLLPQRKLIPFARRNDLAQSAGTYDAESQAARARMVWAIDDGAISQVNAHFEVIATSIDREGRTHPSLLVIDEFGQLELMRGEGLVSAMRLVDWGATAALPHALVVVRKQLLETALNRFEHAAWNGMRVIGPDEDGRLAVLEAFGL